MNKYSIRDFCHKRFAGYSSTLKQTSYDQANDEFLCGDELLAPVYDFDAYVEANFDQSRLPASPDAILLGEKKFYFIEFKNQYPAKIDSADIKNKFAKGTEILKDITSTFSAKDVEFIFCVVHRKQNLGNAHFIANYIEGRVTKFGLDNRNRELGDFYDKIITESVDFYAENFPHLKCLP